MAKQPQQRGRMSEWRVNRCRRRRHYWQAERGPTLKDAKNIISMGEKKHGRKKLLAERT